MLENSAPCGENEVSNLKKSYPYLENNKGVFTHFNDYRSISIFSFF